MFIIETNKLILCFNHKCASRTICKDILSVDHSLLKYYSIEETISYLNNISDIEETISYQHNISYFIPKIFVVREPKDRYLSAYQKAQDLQYENNNVETYKDFERMLKLHGAPYMYKIPKSLKFNIIDFSDIQKYFNSSLGNEEKSIEKRIWKKEYDKVPNMQEEIAQYNWILENKEKITPDYLNKLLSNSKHLKLHCINYRETVGNI